jgi:hypothetical protein
MKCAPFWVSDSAETAFNGMFTMTFANGTLVGNLGEPIDFSGGLTAIIINQTMNVTGGTGAFPWYNGIITHSGTIDATTSAVALLSGSGRLNTTPEPGWLAVLPLGITALYFIKRSIRS